MKIFRWIIISRSKYQALLNELDRLRIVELSYIRLTDRDEKGRFVK